MKELFPGHFANSVKDIESLWQDCIFVLDANVLLSLYRYSDSTRSELLRVLEAFVERLWVPHRVAYEYLSNRLVVINEQAKFYDDAIKRIEALKKLLENSNQHPFVATKTLDDSILIFSKLTSELAENRLIHEKRVTQDDIKDSLEIILSNRVGQAYEKDQLEAILVSGKARYEEKVPPGFGDAKKGGDSDLFVDKCRPYGDLIVWLQMLDHAKEVDKPIIFVTADVKEDWWTVFQGKTIGPHPQLVQEFLEVSGNAFYMYTPDKFLERASSFLDHKASEQSVKEIRDLQVEDEFEFDIFDRALNSAWPDASKKNSFESGPKITRNLMPENEMAVEFSDLPWNEASAARKSIDADSTALMQRLYFQIDHLREAIAADQKRLYDAKMNGLSDLHESNFLRNRINELDKILQTKMNEYKITLMNGRQ